MHRRLYVAARCSYDVLGFIPGEIAAQLTAANIDIARLERSFAHGS